jgi:hypothetical protein
MEEKTGMIGLEVNKRRTNYMIMSTSESRRKPQDLKVEGKSFIGVSSFKYLGNRNANCIRERIQPGNRAYFPNLRILKIKIISRAAKLQIYKTLIRPVATYGAQTP